MNLWLSGLFLVVGLFLSCSALTPEECKPLVEPKSMEDHSEMLTMWNFIMGYNDNDVFNAILKKTQSSRFNVTQSPSSPNEVFMIQENRINGTCIASKAPVTIDGVTAHAQMINVTSRMQSLPTCEGCLVFQVHSTTSHLDDVLEKLHFDSATTAAAAEPQASINALYLMAKGTSVEDSALEHFKKQAECLGFTGEPSFHYDPKNGFCNEDETITIPTQ